MTLERETPNVPGYGFVNTGYATSFTDYKESATKVVVTSTDREDTWTEINSVTIDLNTFQLTFLKIN